MPDSGLVDQWRDDGLQLHRSAVQQCSPLSSFSSSPPAPFFFFPNSGSGNAPAPSCPPSGLRRSKEEIPKGF
jgi:hypothetical protein